MNKKQLNSVKAMMIAVAFVDGALRITNIPTFYLWKDYLGVSPGVNCLLRYITKLPWCTKPFFAYFSDRYYIFGYRTKIYFIFMGIFQVLTFGLLFIPSTNLPWVTLLILLGEATVAFRDSLAEGLMVVVSRDEDASAGHQQESSSQRYISIIFIVRFLGTLVSSFVSGLLLEHFTPHQILAMCAFFPLVNLVHALLFFDEPVVHDQSVIKSKFEDFNPWDILAFVDRQGLTSFLFYVVTMLLWPNTISGLRYYLIDTLGMSSSTIGSVFTIASAFYLVYMFLLNRFFPNYKYRNFYTSICVMMVIDSLTRSLQLLPKLREWAYGLAVVDQTVNNLFYDLPMIPLLAIVCRTCPEFQEATYYAFFVSLSNFFCSLANFTGYLFLDLMAVSTADFSNMHTVNALCLLWTIMIWHFGLMIKFPDAKAKHIEEEERPSVRKLNGRLSEYSSLSSYYITS